MLLYLAFVHRSHWEGEQDGACEYGHAGEPHDIIGAQRYADHMHGLAPKDHPYLFNGAVRPPAVSHRRIACNPTLYLSNLTYLT
jgi:hypothetical protein